MGLALLSFALVAPRLISPVGFSGIDPQVVGVGRAVAIACGNGDRIYVLTSQDGGASFSAPAKLPTAGRLSLGMRRGPRIAMAGRTIVVSAVYGAKGGGQDGDLLAWRSDDDGRTWRGPSRVSDVAGSASEGLHAMAASANGTLACAWLDHRESSAQDWLSTSTDGGATWTKNVCVYRSPDGHVCECCHPSAAFGPKGEIYVMFRNWLKGSRDMYLAESKDGGNRFLPAVKLGTGTWPLDACPMDGGAIAVDADGTVQTAWRRDQSVFTCRPGHREIRLGEGIQPWIASVKHQSTVVWQRSGIVQGQTSPGKQTALREGRNPVVTSLSDPSYGSRSIAVWADSAGRIWEQILP